MNSPIEQTDRQIRLQDVEGLKALMEKRGISLDEAYKLACEDVIRLDPAAETIEYEEHLGPFKRAYEFLKKQSSSK